MAKRRLSRSSKSKHPSVDPYIVSIGKHWLRKLLQRVSLPLVISTAILLVFLAIVFWKVPDAIPGLAQRCLGLIFAALVGAVYFYATREPDMQDDLLARMQKGQHLDFGKQLRAVKHEHLKVNLPILGETTVRSIVGVVLIVTAFGWWLTPFAPVAVAERKIEDVAEPLTSEIMAVILVRPDADLVVAQPPTVPMAARRLAKLIPDAAPPMMLVRKAISQGKYDLARRLLIEAAADEHIEHIELEVAAAQNEMYAGEFGDAVVCYKKALDREPNNPTLLAQAAVAWLHAGDYRQAQQLIARAIHICRAAQPAEAFHLATCLHIQAAVFTVVAYRYDLVERNNRQAQDLWSADEFPEHHPAKAASLNNQAILFTLTGNLPGARSMNAWAVDEWGKLDERSPQLAAGLGNEAMRLHVEGYYTKSQQVADRELAMLRNTLPVGHPVLAMGMDNAAVADLALGEYTRAEPADIMALVSTFEKRLGRQSPAVAAAMNTVAESYMSVALPAKARSYYEQALEVTQASLGPSHPYMLAGLMGLADVFLHQSRYDQARSVCEQARAIAEAAFPKEHPAAARCMIVSAKILAAEGKTSEAQPLFEQALEIAKKRFGDAHPMVAECLAGLASLDNSPHTLAAGVARYEESLKIYERLLGPQPPNHPAVASLLFGMAKLNAQSGKIDKAHEQLARCLQIQEQTLVPYDPQLADTLLAQAELLRAEKTPDNDKIQALEKRAEQIRENFGKENRR